MSTSTEPSTSRRWLARSLGLVIVVVIGIFPAAFSRDSYPLSNYPMFSSRRTAIEPVHTVVAVDRDGTPRRLSPTQISGNDEVVSAAQLVYRAIARDGGIVLCDDVARRVIGRYEGGTELEVVTERYDAIDWYEGRRLPVSRVVHTSCRVPEAGS